MSRKLKSFLKYFISIFLTFLFLYLAFQKTDWNKLLNSLKNANYFYAFLMFLCLMLSHCLRALRWKYFLFPIKENLKFKNLFSSMMIGYAVNNFLPRGGEVVRTYVVGKLEGISRSSAFGTVVMERIIDVISFLILVAIIPIVYSGPLTQQFPWLMNFSLILSISTLFILAITIFILLKREFLFKHLNIVTKKISLTTSQKIEKFFHSFLDGFLFIKETKNYFIIFCTSCLIWFFYILMMYCAFFSFNDLEKYHLDINTAIVLQAISSIGIGIPTPGGTGSYHFITTETLTKLYNVDKTLAQSYATLTHAIGYLGVLIIGIFYFVKYHLHFSDVIKESENEN